MSPTEKIAEVKQVRKARAINNTFVVLVVLPLMWMLFRYYVPFAAWATSTPEAEVGALGPAIVEPATVISLYVPWFALVSISLAVLFRKQFKEDAAPGWSVTLLLFLAFFLGAAIMAGGIL